ncbi:MAG TPA: hypothetical protein VF828_02825 [Patescibacteria group bacterium]
MIKSFFGLILLILIGINLSSPIYGIFNQVINISVKASVCGDGVVEGSEDCEGSNLNNQTCRSIGYASGTLVCDVACSFDTSNCIPLPTSTPTLTSTPRPTSTATPTSAPTSTLTPSPTLTPTPTRLPTAIPTLTVSLTPLPTYISLPTSTLFIIEPSHAVTPSPAKFHQAPTPSIIPVSSSPNSPLAAIHKVIVVIVSSFLGLFILLRLFFRR